MWEDLPKKTSTGTKIGISLLVIIIIIGLGYVIYIIIKNNQTPVNQTSPAANTSAKVSGSPAAADSSPETSPSTLISPSPSATVNLQIPTGETYAISSTADTNGDGKDETLVITQMASGKYHAYILSADGQSIFDNKELDRKPVRIATQTYNTNETYLSWMLVFTEQSGDLAFVHWNGTKYEIPQSEGI